MQLQFLLDWLLNHPVALVALGIFCVVGIGLIGTIIWQAFTQGREIKIWGISIGPWKNAVSSEDTDRAQRKILEEELVKCQNTLHYIWGLHRVQFAWKKRSFLYEISANGDTYFVEEAVIQAVEAGKVHFYSVRLGVTTGNPEDNRVESFKAFNVIEKHPLQWFMTEQASAQVQFVVILDPPLETGDIYHLRVKCLRPQLFHSLINDLHDQGTIGLNSVEEMELRIIVPPEYEIISFAPYPRVGSVMIEAQGRHVLWSVTMPPDNNYVYTIAITKKGGENEP